jgi:uncharacterized protein YjbJ (UPF0337 family)
MNRTPEGDGVMAGTTDKAKGVVKEGAGKVTGDKRMESEGKADRAKGEVKDAAHEVKESSKGVRDSFKKR